MASQKLKINMNRNEQQDLKTLANAFYKELSFIDGIEYGWVGLDCKRPFGNSQVEDDILDLLEVGPENFEYGEPTYSNAQRDYARTLYTEKLVPFLKEQWQKQNSHFDKNNG